MHVPMRWWRNIRGNVRISTSGRHFVKYWVGGWEFGLQPAPYPGALIGFEKRLGRGWVATILPTSYGASLSSLNSLP
jgi:hypothetical protein